MAVYPEPMQAMWRDRAATARAEGLEPLVDPMVDMWFTDDYRTDPDGASATCGSLPAHRPGGLRATCEALARST